MFVIQRIWCELDVRFAGCASRSQVHCDVLLVPDARRRHANPTEKEQTLAPVHRLLYRRGVGIQNRCLVLENKDSQIVSRKSFGTYHGYLDTNKVTCDVCILVP